MQPVNSYRHFGTAKCLQLPGKVLEFKSLCGLLGPEVADITFFHNFGNYI
jgi:hypothetical protein